MCVILNSCPFPFFHEWNQLEPATHSFTIPRFSSRQRFRHSAELLIIFETMMWGEQKYVILWTHSDGAPAAAFLLHHQRHFLHSSFSYGGTRVRERRLSSSVRKVELWNKQWQNKCSKKNDRKRQQSICVEIILLSDETKPRNRSRRHWMIEPETFGIARMDESKNSITYRKRSTIA